MRGIYSVVKDSLNNLYYLELEEANKDDENVPILLKIQSFLIISINYTKCMHYQIIMK